MYVSGFYDCVAALLKYRSYQKYLSDIALFNLSTIFQASLIALFRRFFGLKIKSCFLPCLFIVGPALQECIWRPPHWR